MGRYQSENNLTTFWKVDILTAREGGTSHCLFCTCFLWWGGGPQIEKIRERGCKRKKKNVTQENGGFSCTYLALDTTTAIPNYICLLPQSVENPALCSNKLYLLWYVVVCVLSCIGLCSPVDCGLPGSLSMGFTSKKTGVVCRFLLERFKLNCKLWLMFRAGHPVYWRSWKRCS